ncbi:MAG: hypothetical protein WC958_04465 [Dehalococcoidales bacterium]
MAAKTQTVKPLRFNKGFLNSGYPRLQFLFAVVTAVIGSYFMTNEFFRRPARNGTGVPQALEISTCPAVRTASLSSP